MVRDDLLARAQEPSVRAMLESAWRKESTAQRTADPFEVWCRGRATQVAAAWVLSVVFVRTLEDRGYLARRRIAGEGADDSEQQFVSVAPFLSARDYLLTVFREVGSLPGAEEIFDVRHNPVWVFGPSSGAARKLIDFFRQVDDAGQLRMRYEGADTRFLGDLYQDLDEDVRSRYALLQTPEFVEEFILGETLDPAIRTFGLSEVKVIDPTCGSGHFLLGAFHRLLAGWKESEPGTDVRVLAQRALGQVYGTDLNPYAVAIARFRLTLAYLREVTTEGTEGTEGLLGRVPPLKVNLAVADSLLHGRGEAQMGFAQVAPLETRAGWGADLFALEDEGEALRILGQRYAAVVGNPPYITEKDPARRELYRKLYDSAAGKFALAAPFTERFFDLARDGGYVGLINSNSFMKREFGKRLIEDVLPRYELEHVVDTSGAFIPGHGTPTVLLFGRNQQASQSSVMTVMGKRGEPTTPEDPANGLVWASIRDHHREIGFENDYVSATELDRTHLAKHPWSLGGGGASELKAALESRAEGRLKDIVEDIGFASFTGLDDAFIVPSSTASTQRIESEAIRPMIIGEVVRDWAFSPAEVAIAPYHPSTQAPIALDPATKWAQFLWRFRTCAEGVTSFGGRTRKECGDRWWEWYRWQAERYLCPYRIAFAFVATHNHFVLDRGGKVFNRSAPIIKLPEGATEEDHLALLAYLNSSTAGFYWRQVAHSKGAQGINEGIKTETWEQFLEYSGAVVGAIPVPRPNNTVLALARGMQTLAELRSCSSPEVALKRWMVEGELGELPNWLSVSRQGDEAALGRMCAIQEEIDWELYAAFGLLSPDEARRLERQRGESWGDAFPKQIDDSPGDVGRLGLRPGHRAFEIALAHDSIKSSRPTAWFERNGYASASTFRESYCGPCTRLVEARLALIESNPSIRLIERPEYKRRWGLRSWDDEVKDGATALVLEALEGEISKQTAPATVRSAAQLLEQNESIREVVRVVFPDWSDWSADVARLVASEASAFGDAYRYTDAGLQKRLAWERTWDLQRREDAGENVGTIPVPPKYDQKDFRSPTYWQLRGKLDVPKERFISYPGCESDDDPSPLIGWAGWDHLQQAQALATLYTRRKDEDGWGKERLTPILAGLLELVPWLKQWHNEPDERFGGACAGDSFDAFVREQALQLGLTLEDLRAWRPTQKVRGRAGKAAGAPKGKDNGPTPEAVVEAVQSLADAGDGTVAQAALAEALGVTSAAAGKLAAALVEQGKLEMVSARPRKYRRAP